MRFNHMKQIETKRTSTRSSRRAWYFSALFLMPVVFTVITFALFYFIFGSIFSVYAGAVMLFVGDEVYDAQYEVNDLLSKSGPVQDTEPIDWVPLEDHSNPEDFINPEDEQVFIRASDIIMPQPGDLYANITISGTKVDSPVFWGDSERELNNGVGTYMGGWLPGWGRTVMMAGHRNTDFADFRNVEIGAIITVRTHYETYTYEVVDIAVFHMNDTKSYDFLREEENIILYTCYPFDRIGAAVERLFIYGEPLTGTPVARYS